MAYKNISGISLLEIMVTLLLSAILLSTIFKYSYYLENALNFSNANIEVLEKYNVIFAWMIKDIEMAGSVGCVNFSLRENIIDNDNYLSTAWLKVTENELESQYMSAEQFAVLENTSSNEVIISGENSLKQGDVVFIENCWEAEITKISEIHNINYGAQQKLVFYSPIHMHHIDDALIGKLIRHHYFIKKITRKNLQGDYIFSLYVNDEQGRDNEVLEDIQSMHLEQSNNSVAITMFDGKNDSPFSLSASAYNAS